MYLDTITRCFIFLAAASVLNAYFLDLRPEIRPQKNLGLGFGCVHRPKQKSIWVRIKNFILYILV